MRSTVLAFAAAAAFVSFAQAQQKEIKVGVIYDYTGAFAAGGSEAAGLGTKIAIDMLNEKGGVEGYKIVPIYADAQSKTEVAINEMTRLLDQEKVNLIMGVYSSAQCAQTQRTSRCASDAIIVLAMRNGSTPMSVKRVTAPAASFVCNVLKTR